MPFYGVAMQQTKPRLRPSKQLEQAIAMLGGTNPAAKEWRVEYGSLHRWLKGDSGITDSTLLAICAGSGLSFEQAFKEGK